jgi:chitooligosaccharide deacetylase
MATSKARPTAVPLSRRGLLGAGVACLAGLAGEEWPRDMITGGRTDGHTTGRQGWLAADPGALVSLGRAGRRLAVTFDDGPDPAYTPRVLDLLARYEVPATFFVIGRNAVAHPGLVARILAEGHHIAEHTRDHLWLDALGRRAVAAQMDGGAADLVSAGVTPGGRLFRVPRGWTSTTVADVARERDLRSVFWTVCLEAYLSHGPRRAVAAMGRRVGPGAIVLCHDGGHLDGPNPQSVDRSRTLEALPDLLRAVRARGLNPITLDGLAGGSG